MNQCARCKKPLTVNSTQRKDQYGNWISICSDCVQKEYWGEK